MCCVLFIREHPLVGWLRLCVCLCVSWSSILIVLYSCVKVKKSSRKANYAVKNAPLFCEIWFVKKGKHVWTREASEGPNALSPNSQPEITTGETLRSMSFQYGNSNAIHPEFLRSHSAKFTPLAGSSNWVLGDTVHVDVPSLPTSSHSLHSLQNSFSSTTSSGSENNSSERMVSAISDPKVEEVSLIDLLTEAQIEAEASMNEVFAAIKKRKKLELEAIEIINKVSMSLVPILCCRDFHFTILWLLGVRVAK